MTASEHDAVAPRAAPAAGPGWGRSVGVPTTALLLRHGQTELSSERRFAGRVDIPLTKEGLAQARKAARRLAGSGVNAIVSSPLARARRTAEAVAEATGAPLEVDDDLAESDFGQWEGLTFAEAERAWPDELTAWLASPDAAPPGGETFAAVARRVLGALDRMLGAYRQQTVVVVSHVTPIKTILCRALLAPPATMFRINLDAASMSHADFFDDGNAVVRSLNDTAHLRARRRRGSPRGLDWMQRRARWPGGRGGSGSARADEEGLGSAGQGGR